METDMFLLNCIYVIFLVLLIISFGWLLLLTIGSWLYRPKRNPGAPLLKLGVIVPSHNEELGIRSTIDAVRSCDYPEELLKIMVIADNCTDRTAEIARECGVITIERTDLTNRGKGQALDWFLKNKQDLYADLDGISFVDADVIPDRNMFKELSYGLSVPGTQIVQGFNGVANELENWRTALNSAAFNVFNHLRMAGNNLLFGTAVLKGLGMAFKTDILVRYGWPAHSVVEDLEFTLILLEDDIGIQYMPQAIITSEIAGSRKQADSQRQRWEGGRFKLAAQLLPQLLKKFVSGKFRFLHAIMDLVIPPLALLVALLFVTSCIGFLFFPATTPLLLSFFVILLFYVASGQLQRKAGLKLWLYLITAPAFILWKLLIYVKMIFSKQDSTWVRTIRKKEMESKQGSNKDEHKE